MAAFVAGPSEAFFGVESKGLRGCSPPQARGCIHFHINITAPLALNLAKNCWLINYTTLYIIAAVAMMFNPCHMLCARHFLSCMQHAKRSTGNGWYSIALCLLIKYVCIRTWHGNQDAAHVGYMAWESGCCSCRLHGLNQLLTEVWRASSLEA